MGSRSGRLLARPRLRAGAAAALLLLAAAPASAGEAAGATAPAQAVPADASSDSEAPAEASPDGATAGDASPEGEVPIAAEREATVTHSQEEDPANIATPVFPQVRYRDAIRLRLQSRFVPRSDFGAAEVALYHPSARLRVTVPVANRGVLQLTARGAGSRYDFSGTSDLFGLGPASGDVLEGLYEALLLLQGAYRINDSRYLFVDGESWSVLGAVYGRSRWEEGSFEEGLTAGGTLGLGYQSARLRVALGARVEDRLDGDGVRVNPIGTLRWDPIERLTLRNRGTGGQIEYRLTDRLELFAAGYLTTERYRLADRPGVAGPLTLRDRQVQVGVGFEWKLSRHFRLNLEGGVVTSHEIRVNSGDDRLSSLHADPSGYLDVLISLRP